MLAASIAVGAAGETSRVRNIGTVHCSNGGSCPGGRALQRDDELGSAPTLGPEHDHNATMRAVHQPTTS